MALNKRISSLEIIILLAAILAAGLSYYVYRLFYHDDAYISLRYAYNFLHGHGLVWNPGERVEGYSNFLQIVLTCLLGKLGLDLVSASKAIGIGSFIALCAYVSWHVRRRYASVDNCSTLWLLPAVVVFTSLPLIIWSIGGLETVLFSLAITMGIWTFARSLDDYPRGAALAGLFFALSSLTRPDGFLFLAVALLCGTAWGGSHGDGRWRRVLWLIVPFLALIIPHLIFRYFYYGGLLPNTWYVKGTMNWDKVARGVNYVYQFSISLPLLIPLALAGAIVTAFKRAFDRVLGYLGVTIVVYLLYVAVIGGDHMPAFRFMAPLVPTLALFVFLTIRKIPALHVDRRSLWATLGIAVLSCAQLALPHEIVNRARITDGAAFIGRIVGEYIEQNWPKGSLIALNTAGSTPYYAPDLRFIDMLGLNDTTIARRKDVSMVAFYQWVPGHEKGDGKYVLSRNPDAIIAGGSNGDVVKNLWFLTEYELVRLPEFTGRYQIQGIMLPTTSYPGYENYRETRSGTLKFVYYGKKR